MPSTDVSSDPTWGFNPISRRYVKRTGAIWRRLVKSGAVQDSEVAAQLDRPSIGAAWAALREARGDTPSTMRPDNVTIPEPAPERRVSRANAVKTQSATKKALREHLEELEALPPDEVEDLMRKLHALRTGAPKWRATDAAPTPSATETERDSAYSSEDEIPARSAPIRIPRRGRGYASPTRRARGAARR